jgi:acetate kinase
MAAALGGIDAIVFTGGVGEHAAEVRQAAADGLAFLGIEIDAPANRAGHDKDADVSAEGARVRTLVVLAREDVEVAREVRKTLA